MAVVKNITNVICVWLYHICVVLVLVLVRFVAQRVGVHVGVRK